MSLPTGPNFSLSARAHVAMSPKQPALSTTTTSVHQPSTSTSNSLSTSTTSPSSTRAGASFSPHSPSSPFTSQPTPSTNPVQAPPPEASSELLPQCINEKVKAALEDDMELSQIALSSPIVLSPTGAPSDALRGPSRTRGNNLTGPSHPVRSRSRGRTGQMQQFQSHTTISSDREWDEKRGLRDPAPGSPVAGGRHLASPPVRSSSLTPASFASPHSCDMGRPSASPPPYSTLPPNYASSYSSSVRRMLLTERLKPWVPFLAYAGTTFGFILAIMFWKDEVFGGLDELATWLRGKGSTGYAVMFFMIFLTCIRESSLPLISFASEADKMPKLLCPFIRPYRFFQGTHLVLGLALSSHTSPLSLALSSSSPCLDRFQHCVHQSQPVCHTLEAFRESSALYQKGHHCYFLSV